MTLKKLVGTGAIAGALGFSAIGLAGVANAAPPPPAAPVVFQHASLPGWGGPGWHTAPAEAAGTDPALVAPAGVDPVGADRVSAGADPVGADPALADPAGADPVGAESVGADRRCLRRVFRGSASESCPIACCSSPETVLAD
jgi:hypothetical protein